MEIRRTVQVKLDVPEERHEDLKETFYQFKKACQYVADVAWHADEYVVTSKSQLHELTYEDVRASTDLPANHVQAARNLAAEALKGCVERLKNGERTSKPQFTSNVVRYDARTVTYKDGSCTLSTVNCRVEAEYVLPDGDDNPQTEYLQDDWEKTSATLHYRDGRYYLHIGVKKEIESEETENGTSRSGSFDGSQIEDLRTVLGVDLNTRGSLAVSSTGAYWSIEYLNHWRREYEKRRKSLQEHGSRYAHENIQCVGEKESGRFKNHLHRVAKEIVEEAVENGCSIIAMEDLERIRDDLNRWHDWAYRRLYQYVEYKAEERGVRVTQENPEHTSQRCSKCGFTHPQNRSGSKFKCRKCGYENHADYNAAKNVGMKYLRRSKKATGGGAPVGMRLNNGTLKANGEYSPTATG
ncbi:RNA-guided endonuclease InsQ/TnpB family protein [Halorutilales archaeon Cl-col2-1]